MLTQRGIALAQFLSEWGACLTHPARVIVTFVSFMSERPICKSADHLFVPIIEVSIPLLRCIHCNVFAYHDTVKQLAKNRRYQSDVEPLIAKPAVSYWRRLWTSLRRNMGFT
jgi:hypothetical protein